MNVRDLSDEELAWADYVFISTMTIRKGSAQEVIPLCRRIGVKFVAGGPLFTACGNEFPEVELMVRAGFEEVFIGIETPCEESNAESGKLQSKGLTVINRRNLYRGFNYPRGDKSNESAAQCLQT